MSEIFSTVEFNTEFYFFAGTVTQEDLSTFEPLQNALMCLEESERLPFWITKYCLNTDEPDRDMTETDLGYITQHFDEIVDEGVITVLEDTKFVVHGVLPKPYEDFYNLQGKERDDYLAAKKEYIASREEVIAQLTEDGYSEDDLDEYFRYANAQVDTSEFEDIDDLE